MTSTSNLRPVLVSVNVGQVRDVDWRGERVRTGIWKASVGDAAVAVRGVNLAGDDQADRTVHGGPDKAVYAYAAEDYDHWRDVEGVATEPGLFGENLTVRGLDLRAAVVGERWRVGTTELEVAQPRMPCFKLGMRLGDPAFPRRFMAAGRLGAYLRIVAPGSVRAGDAIDVLARPGHGVTLGRMADTLLDHRLAPSLRAAAAHLPDYWRRVAERA